MTSNPSDPTQSTMPIVVSGKTYYACMDPRCTSVPGERGWPTATLRRVGRGVRADYGNVPLSTANEILDHLWTIGPTWAAGDDPGTRAEGRAIVKDLERLEAIEKYTAGQAPSGSAGAATAAAPNAPAWVRDDGGRAEAGYRGDANDCVTRAIAIAADLPYQQVYDMVNAAATHERPGAAPRRNGKRSSARTGVYTPTTRRIMEQLGWQWTPTMAIGTGCTVHLTGAELPAGRLVVQVSKHVVAVIDGIVHDTHDSTRGGTRCVYGYYRRDQKTS